MLRFKLYSLSGQSFNSPRFWVAQNKRYTVIPPDPPHRREGLVTRDYIVSLVPFPSRNVSSSYNYPSKTVCLPYYCSIKNFIFFKILQSFHRKIAINESLVSELKGHNRKEVKKGLKSNYCVGLSITCIGDCYCNSL